MQSKRLCTATESSLCGRPEKRLKSPLLEQLERDTTDLWRFSDEQLRQHAQRVNDYAQQAMDAADPGPCVLACHMVERTARRSEMAVRACLGTAVVRTLVHLLSAGGDVADASANAMCALANTGGEDAQNAVREAGGVLALLQRMGGGEKQRAALSALYSLCKDNQESKQIVALSLSLELLLCLASNWNNVDEVQRGAINVLGTVMRQSRENKHALMRQGAVRVAVEALKSRSSLVRSEAALMVGQFEKEEDDEDEALTTARLGCGHAVHELVVAVKRGRDETALFALDRCVSHIATARDAVTADRDAVACLAAYTGATHPRDMRHSATNVLAAISEVEHHAPGLIFCSALDACKAVAAEGQLSGDGHALYASARVVVESIRSAMRSEPLVRGMLLTTKLLDVNRAAVFRALADLCQPAHCAQIFIGSGGLGVLLESLQVGLPGACASLLQLHAKAAPTRVVKPAGGRQRSGLSAPVKIVLIVAEERIDADATALAACSAVFRTMLRSVNWGAPLAESREVMLPELRADVARCLVACASSERAPLPADCDGLMALFEAADRFAMLSLKRRCVDALGSHLTEGTLDAIFDLADAHYSDGLRDACVLWVLRSGEWERASEGMGLHLRDMMARVLQPAAA